MIFLLKFLFSKLKQVTLSARRLRWNHVVLAVCLIVLVWECYGPDAETYVPRHLRKYLQFPEGFTIPEKQLTEIQLKKVTREVDELNARFKVINCDIYNPVNSETTIIVVRVHKDLERLQYLIVSLGQVQNIDQVLLIFSHSYFDDIINSLVRSIDFCKVMQIFYPYSLQLYPDKFPGVDPDDCNVTLRPEAGDPAGSSSSRLPCFARVARRTEQKQHWWWAANFVFEGLAWSKQITLFLEEDNYVFPDLLHMLKYARRVLPYFPTVEVMSFGRPHLENLDYDLLMIDAWSPPFDKGLAFNKTTWRKISERASLYCFYDDCSWSYSLVHLFGNFTRGIAEMAACSGPRVLSTSMLPSGRRAARWARAAAARARLFPAQVRATVTVGVRGRVRRPWRPPHGNGGCADLRDQILCLDPLMTTTTEITTVTTIQ